MKKLLFISIAFTALSLYSSSDVNAQGVGINSSGSPADNSAILDASSSTKGTLITRMTITQRDAISNPAQSLLIFNTTTNCFEFFSNGNWLTLSCGCNPPAAAGNVSGTATVCQGTNNVAFSVAPIPNATGYIWSLPTGASIVTGTNTNSISVNFASNASSGDITVYGTSVSCGNGAISPIFSVTVNPSLSASVSIISNPAAVSGTCTVCGPSASFTASPVNGGTSPTYQWYLNGSFVGSGPGYSSSSLVTGNTVTCVMTSNAVCATGSPATSSPIAMVVNQIPAASITGTTTICSGNSTILTANGGGTYLWNTSATTATISVSPPATTAYVVTVTNGAGCTATATATVTVLGTPNGNISFSYLASVQTWVVPACVSQLTITATGAGGGNSTLYSCAGGFGAQVVGVVTVAGGHIINVITAGAGGTSDRGGGGGGGTYVWDATSNTLLVVGGGGGGGGYNNSSNGGGSGQSNPATLNTPTRDPMNQCAPGGTGGNGGGAGTSGNYNGSGGAGWLSNGATATGTFSGTVIGGASPANGAAGGSGGINYPISGGYGGGGGGDLAGGGGGGYNGGGGGMGAGVYGGGGGGSYCSGTVTSTSASNTGNGSVTITW